MFKIKALFKIISTIKDVISSSQGLGGCALLGALLVVSSFVPHANQKSTPPQCIPDKPLYKEPGIRSVYGFSRPGTTGYSGLPGCPEHQPTKTGSPHNLSQFVLRGLIQTSGVSHKIPDLTDQERVFSPIQGLWM